MAIRLALAILALALILSGAFYFRAQHSSSMSQRTITIGPTAVVVDVADTEARREQGLSGRAGLAPGQGMLFTFDQEGTWGIWMKDMRFPIDILWANASGTVITLRAHISPDTYPQVFYPDAPARYVVELPAGYAASQGIAEGDKIVL